ncbi:fimbrial biogenesis chaperone [Providencia rustigianii]|uniref:fimbrial biogenesis chaperone n=1 Tax=Providencia rustigianii TaxID=158850 RepID=UPI002AD35EB1|nr:hypothetical protein [Providencia rustigianii]
MNFQRITFNGKQLKNVSYVAPFSTITFSVNDLTQHGVVKWELINDFGATTKASERKI